MERLPNIEGQAQYEHISLLDPLKLDTFFLRLPEMNKLGQTEFIVDQLSATSNELLNQPLLSQEESIACLRDLDFLIGSALRHQIDPFAVAPSLQQQLIEMGEIANTVPRGSVYTYTVVNPKDDRRRSFTGSAEENIFIDAVAESIESLEKSYRILSTQIIDNNYEFCDALNQVADSVDVMTDSIVRVHRTVSPQFFTEEMRPFFDSLVINGKEYAGAGGAQMQLLGVDFMLWGIDENDVSYVDYFAENYQYLTPDQQKATELFAESNGMSIVKWIKENARSGDDINKSTANLLRKLRKFRYPHRKVAQDNFKVRANGSVGSGKYTPDILDFLIQKTEDNLTEVEAVND